MPSKFFEHPCSLSERTLIKLFAIYTVVIVLFVAGFAKVAIAANVDQSGARSLQAELKQTFLQPEKIYGRQAVYKVFRNRKPIGEHILTFVNNADGLVVTADSSLDVRILGITVYSYAYQSREVWTDGQFSKVTTSISESRKPKRQIDAVVERNLLYITDRGKRRSAPLVEFPGNHWHPSVLGSKRVFHNLHGKVYEIELEEKGWEKTSLASGKVISAKHYKYLRGFNADVWYDKDNRWVKLSFKADDGSDIVYSCSRCQP